MPKRATNCRPSNFWAAFNTKLRTVLLFGVIVLQVQTQIGWINLLEISYTALHLAPCCGPESEFCLRKITLARWLLMGFPIIGLSLLFAALAGASW